MQRSRLLGVVDSLRTIGLRLNLGERNSVYRRAPETRPACLLGGPHAVFCRNTRLGLPVIIDLLIDISFWIHHICTQLCQLFDLLLRGDEIFGMPGLALQGILGARIDTVLLGLLLAQFLNVTAPFFLEYVPDIGVATIGEASSICFAGLLTL